MVLSVHYSPAERHPYRKDCRGNLLEETPSQNSFLVAKLPIQMQQTLSGDTRLKVLQRKRQPAVSALTTSHPYLTQLTAVSAGSNAPILVVGIGAIQQGFACRLWKIPMGNLIAPVICILNCKLNLPSPCRQHSLGFFDLNVMHIKVLN